MEVSVQEYCVAAMREAAREAQAEQETPTAREAEGAVAG
jgi:hypothetical protein